MKRLNKKKLWLLLFPFLLAACQSYKKVPYLQNTEALGPSASQEKLYDAKNYAEGFADDCCLMH